MRPPGSQFFHFHAVFGKKIVKLSQFRSWRTPLRKILDPLLAINGPWIKYNDFYFLGRNNKLYPVADPEFPRGVPTFLIFLKTA